MRIVDISIPLETGMFKFPRPDHVTVSISAEGTYEEVACRTSRLVLGSHSGTHVDAPMHMIEGADPIDQVPLDYVFGPAQVLRIPAGPKEVIDVDRLQDTELTEKRVILNTGWHKQWGSDRFYREYPVATDEFARALVDGGVRCIVVDLPVSVSFHKIVLGAGGCLVENVANLDDISSDKVLLVALPIKAIGIDAAPARVVVVEGFE